MKNRLIAFTVCLTMVFCCSCGSNIASKKVVDSNDIESVVQTVISMNPTIINSSGETKTASKSVSESMAVDINSQALPSLYENSDWQWAYSVGEDEYKQRAVRSLESFKDGSGDSAKGVPYAYTVTDDRASSLSVYDTSKIDITSYDGNLSESGILFTFTGKEKEALIYTADSDGILTLGDVNSGKISLVKGISTIDTDAIGTKEPSGVLLQVYVNSCLLWQDVLGNEALLGEEITSVDFPTIGGIELSAGDSFIITAQTIIDVNGIETGYVDIPDYTSIVKKPIKVGREVEVASQESGTPILDSYGDCNFVLIRSDNADEEMQTVISDFQADMEDSLSVAVSSTTESFASNFTYKIIIGSTDFAESAEVLNEIAQHRTNNKVDFIIRRYGDNVVIGAGGTVGYELAFDYFVKTYCASGDEVIPENLNYVSSAVNGVKMIKIAGGDISDYRIVVSSNASYIERLAASDLAYSVLLASGSEIGIVTDSTSPVPKEIAVGITNRSLNGYLNLATTAENSDFNYKISVSGGKLYILGSATAVNAGCIAFGEELKKNAVFNNGYSLTGSYDGSYSLSNGYKLMIADEFNGTAISKIWRISPSLSQPEYGNYVKVNDDCAWVEDGALVQHVYTDGTNLYGSRLSSGGQLTWKYGYCEIRVKYATTPHLCLGFCCYGYNSPESSRNVEYDIVESLGKNDGIKHTFHTWNNGHEIVEEKWVTNYIGNTTDTEPWGNEYHTIGFEWDTDSVITYVDGVQTTVVDITDPKYECFDYPVIVELTSQFLSELEEQPNADFVEDFTRVDYFRVYQKADNNSTISKVGIY